MSYQLSKTDYILGLTCPRNLWLKINDPKKLRKKTLAEEFDINEGIKVGELAKKLYTDGINIPIEDTSDNIQKTKELLMKRKPLFEAGFEFENYYARVDILVPNGEGWDIIEVKSSTKLKDKFLYDVSFQKFVLESNGLKIKNCFLLHLNKNYIKKGEIDIEKLYTKEDITADVTPFSENVKEIVKILVGMVSSEKPPMGRILYDEKIVKATTHNCLTDGCLELEDNNVFCLYGNKQVARELFKNEIELIKDIPVNYELSERQQIQKECSKTEKPYVNKSKLLEFLNLLQYPIYYLDFETFSTAIPMFDGLNPHAKVPFQFSLHIIDKEGMNPGHYEFLYVGESNPRKDFLHALQKVIGKSGSILVYSQSFEENRLLELAEHFPKHRKWIYQVIDRLVDLRVPFRKFWYYNPEQQGSASIKVVFSAMTEMCYDEMEIRDGRTAHVEFLRIAYEDCCEEEITSVRDNLLRYCKLDTLAQVKVLEKLKDLVK